MSNILANSTFSNFDIDQTSTIFDYSLILYANQWNGDQIPYTYDLIFESHINMTDKVSIAIGNNITNEQLEVLQSSSIMSAYWVNNTTLRLEAYGEKPTIDVPIILSIISVGTKFANDSSLLLFENVIVPQSSWVPDSTYASEKYNYAADIICVGVNENYFPVVIFNPTDSSSGNFSPNSATFDGGIIRIYAKEVPANEIIIPTIKCTFDGAFPVLGAHAANHAKNGIDPITPEMIGAPTLEDVERAISAIPTPDVSGQINEHNTNSESHSDIRKSVSDIIDGTSSAKNATNIYSSGSTSKAYLLGTTSASDGNKATVYNASVYTEGSVLYGAAWNDYAEYRQGIGEIKPGMCVIENGDGALRVSDARLLPGANIVSDTFGFAIGENEECKTPIAVSGRVLAYPAENRELYKPGDAVCSAQNGMISKMTREEIMMYPERIVGTVSEIPNYKNWGAGNIEVDNRIWIKVY